MPSQRCVRELRGSLRRLPDRRFLWSSISKLVAEEMRMAVVIDAATESDLAAILALLDRAGLPHIETCQYKRGYA
jgi:hypothetical protein